MNLTPQVDPESEGIQTPLTLDQAQSLGVILGQIHRQRITVMKLHQTMSPVSNLKAENFLPSKCIVDDE